MHPHRRGASQALCPELWPSPVMRVEKIGYGMGKKDFEAANCLRAMLGETQEGRETIAQLCCNLDDMTPEALGFVQERLWEAGALDVTTTPVGMKKNRPGVLLTCMCRLEDRERLVSLLFRHTTTLGIRESQCSGYTLSRSQRSLETPGDRCGSKPPPAGASPGKSPSMRTWPKSPGIRTCPWTR